MTRRYSFEFWFSEKRITDIRQVETTARYLGTALYWIAAISISNRAMIILLYPQCEHRWQIGIRGGCWSAELMLPAIWIFQRRIGKTHLAQELWTQIDNGQLALTWLKSGRPLRMSAMKSHRPSIRNWKTRVSDPADTEGSGDTNNNLNSMWAVSCSRCRTDAFISRVSVPVLRTPLTACRVRCCWRRTDCDG